MRRLVTLLAIFLVPDIARAEMLVATRHIPGTSIIAPEDVTVAAGDHPSALRSPSGAIGLEARVNLYEGRPIRPEDLGPPALVSRNEIVVLIYRRGALTIETTGRALARAAAGDRLRVMNLASRTVVTGYVRAGGAVLVAPEHPGRRR